MSHLQTVSVIIPTKDRHGSLERLLGLLLRQTVSPTEVVVVDQTESSEGRLRSEQIFAAATGSRSELVYIHDPAIPGAAVARNRGMAVARGDVWLFLDDDMEPEADFLEQLLLVYESDPTVCGVSGIVSNYQQPPLAFRAWLRVFLRGPFHDARQPIYWRAEALRNSGPIRVPHFGSGLMSFRAAQVRDMRFDGSLRGLPPGEDLDFCERLGEDARLVIAPRARIAHQASGVGRTRDYWVKEFVQGKLYVYHRNWRGSARNRLACLWFQLGCGLVAAFSSLRRLSLAPWRAFLAGVREGGRLAVSGTSRAA